MAGYTLKDLVNATDKEIAKLLYQDFRTPLNKRVTVLDLSYTSLKINAQGYSESEYTKIHNTLLGVLRSLGLQNYNKLSDIPGNFINNKTGGVLLIDSSGRDNIFLVAANYEKIRKLFSDKVASHPNIRNTIFGMRVSSTDILNSKGMPSGDVKISEKSATEFGHISSTANEFLTSPLEEKLQSILEYAEITGNNKISEIAKQGLDKLYNIQTDINYVFKNYAPEVISSISDKLGQGFVVVTLHDTSINQKFSDEEKLLYSSVVRKIAQIAAINLKLNITDISGSNNIKEDIVEQLFNSLKIGKSKLRSHSTQKASTSSNVKISSKVASSLKTLVLKQPKSPKRSEISLTSLQNLINQHLQSVISANMGDGSSRNILNYRTGRFAASASVQSMSQSRQGMITAFYSYMKNPYQTFEPGYAQGNPKSRDPKLLIAKSIREIVALRVGNSLRAVSI